MENTYGKRKPKPAFYLAVFAGSGRARGLGLWRFSAARTSPAASSARRIPAKAVEAPDTKSITTAKEYNYVPAQKLPPVQGISSYKPMADRTVRFAMNVWAGWAPIILRQQRLQARQGLEDTGGQGFQSRTDADRRPCCHARRLCGRQRAHRLGHARHGAAVAREPAHAIRA